MFDFINQLHPPVVLLADAELAARSTTLNHKIPHVVLDHIMDQEPRHEANCERDHRTRR